MKKTKKSVPYICALVGLIADVIAIFSALGEWPMYILSTTVALAFSFAALIYIYMRYKERCDFVNFIEHLVDNPDHKFTLLPKICMALDKSKEYNPLHVREMKVTYTCDLSDVDTSEAKKDTAVRYSDTIDYEFTVVNKDLPEEFVCYCGNAYADELIEITQRHGSQSKYERVPIIGNHDQARKNTTVQRYCWQLSKENITNGPTVPIAFRMRYAERNFANTESTTILYPKQYAKNIEKITFKIVFKADKKVLQNVDVIKIWKDGDSFKHTAIRSVQSGKNVAVATIKPDSTKYEAYYLRIRRGLVES